MSKILQILAVTLMTTWLTFGAHTIDGDIAMDAVEIEEVKPVEYTVGKIEEVTENVVVEEVIEESVEVIEEAIEEPADEISLAQNDIELIALITMAESEGEPEEGKRLVIDAILNRVDHERFPNTVHDVIYQKNQFTCTTNGRVNRCYATEENCNLVREEMANRTNGDVIFFTANRYGKYGQPMFSVGNHYFSSY